VTEPSGQEPPDGHLLPTGPATVGISVMIGLVAGWLLKPVSDRFGNPPVVSWLQPVALFVVAAVLLATAFVTYRTVHVHHQWLEPHHAVNRLVLARASVLVGGLVAGGYAGYAVSWLGVPAELAGERIVRSLLAALAGGLIVLGALLLERACRIRSDDEET
jgi:MFS family permease